MKQIIFIVGNYKNGGVPMRATNLANEFGKRGYKVTILVTKEIASEVFFSLHDNVKVVSLNEYIVKHKDCEIIRSELERQKRVIRQSKRIRYISKYLKKWDTKIERTIRTIRKGSILRCFLLVNQNSILIPFGLTYYEQAYYAALGLKCKIIYAERNAPELELPKDKRRADELLSILGKADGAIFQTNEEKEFYKEYINKNVAVIYNPVKKNLPMPFVGERRKVIVNFCRVAEQKNLFLLINSFIELHSEYPEYCLEIYGNAVEQSEELLREQLKSYVSSVSMDKYIHILPPTADVHNKIRDCMMFVSSSDFEGLSNSMIEAMAIGLPCVCTDCLGGGAREMIMNEKNGILVPMKDEEALCRGMKKMIESPEFAEQCGKEATKIRYDMAVENIVDQWLKVIKLTEG